MRADSAPVRHALLQALPEGAALCVAFSGGRDSTVLLHALAALRSERRFVLRAAHVNHGLQPAAGDWAAHCAVLAARLDVPCALLPVTVRNDRGKGMEAAAREARYDALRGLLAPGEWLLTAHHADDQLETVLLHLFRGSGVSGLAGIPRDTAFGAGRLCRPLLAVAAEALAGYGIGILEPAGIAWLTDPMNADRAYDRGYLRHEVRPVLHRRFPAVASAVGRTAAHAAEAASLLDDLAQADAREIVAGNRLALAPLRDLGQARQRNLVRHLVRERGWSTPPERRLRDGLSQLLAAAPGRQPVLAWGGHEVRRFREHLHLLDVAVPVPVPGPPLRWRADEVLHLGGARGELALRPGAGGARLASRVIGAGLAVEFRSGGERLRAGPDRHHRTLKYLFQSRGIVPWMRGHLPLIIAGGQLAAVADLWIADWAAPAPDEAGLQIIWCGHAPLQ